MVFLWFSYGFPMVFLWFSYGFPMVFLWFSYGFLMVFLWFLRNVISIIPPLQQLRLLQRFVPRHQLHSQRDPRLRLFGRWRRRCCGIHGAPFGMKWTEGERMGIWWRYHSCNTYIYISVCVCIILIYLYYDIFISWYIYIMIYLDI